LAEGMFELENISTETSKSKKQREKWLKNKEQNIQELQDKYKRHSRRHGMNK
jgi:hypothetical protein